MIAWGVARRRIREGWVLISLGSESCCQQKVLNTGLSFFEGFQEPGPAAVYKRFGRCPN